MLFYTNCVIMLYINLVIRNLREIIMSKQKWKSLHAFHHQEKEVSYVEYFKEHLIEHLTKEHDPHGESNQPGKVIEASRNTIGELSRIFDAYNFPAPNYEELKVINQKPNGLREHMQENLNGVIPVLLNEERTALHPKVIDAIGRENYEAILKSAQGDEKEVALQFVKAVVISYGQRMIDNTNDAKLKKEAFESILPALDKLASEVTLKGLPEQSKKTNPINTLKMSQELLELLDEAEKAEITIPNSRLMRDKLGVVCDLMDPNNEEYNMLPKETKTQKAMDNYDIAVDSFINGVQKALATEPPKPKEVSWFKQFLRLITGNEKLLQNTDEKRYDRQMKVLSGINDLNKKLNSLPEENELKDISSKPEQTLDQKDEIQMKL